MNRSTERRKRSVRDGELLAKARQWLPEYLATVEIDPQTLHARLVRDDLELTPDLEQLTPAVDEDEILDCLLAAKPRRRLRGLKLLRDAADPDMFDWCVMMLEDESAEVRVAALRQMRECEDGDPEVIRDLAGDPDRRIRGAALAALASLDDDGRAAWVRQGLEDPKPCVRVEVSAVLDRLDPEACRGLFEMALYDNNPTVAKRARDLVQGKGFGELVW
jgi:HEAT repeat protein